MTKLKYSSVHNGSIGAVVKLTADVAESKCLQKRLRKQIYKKQDWVIDRESGEPFIRQGYKPSDVCLIRTKLYTDQVTSLTTILPSLFLTSIR